MTRCDPAVLQVWSRDVHAVPGVCVQEDDRSRAAVPGTVGKTQPADLSVRRAPADTAEPPPEAVHHLHCGVTALTTAPPTYTLHSAFNCTGG